MSKPLPLPFKVLTIIGSTFLLIAIVLISGLIFSQQPGAIPSGINNFGPTGDFSLVDQNGTNVTLNSYLGKVLVIDFIYTHCPDACPAETAEMNSLLFKLQQANYNSNQFHFISISFDYKFDNETTMFNYGKLHLSNTSQFEYWSFLSGSYNDFNKSFLFQSKSQNVTSEYGIWIEYNNSVVTNGFNPQVAPNNTIEYLDHNFALTIVDSHGIRRSVYVGPDWSVNDQFNIISYLINHPDK